MDVTGTVRSALTSGSAVSFGLTTATDGKPPRLASRETGARAPQLVVETVPYTSTPTPTHTPTPSPTSTPTRTPPASSSVLLAVADSYVDASNPAVTPGGSSSLRVDGAPLVRSYLRFDVPGTSRPIARARLRLFANTASSTGYSVHRALSDDWGENTINYDNQPGFSPEAAGASGRLTARTTTEVDVTALVTGSGLVSFALIGTDDTAFTLASRESGANALRLVLDDGSPTTATPTGAPAATATQTGTPSPTPTTTATGTPSPVGGAGFVFTAAGDHGATSASGASLDLLARTGARFHLALGDMSYSDLTPESAWCDYVKSRLGASFPFQMVAGNHEEDSRVDGFIGNFAACLPDRMGSTGVYGREYYFDYAGLARVIMIAADLTVDGVSYDYRVGTPHNAWLADAIDDARARGLPWVIVGMHKVCLSAGNKPCEIGADLLNLLTAKRVDLVLQGHDHDYQRSKQLMCGRVGAFDAACVADTGADGLYTKGAGPVFVIAGTTGGGGLTSINATDPEQPYFARSMGGSSPSPGRGIVRYSVGPTSLTGEFVGSTTTFTDSFTIRSGP